MIKRIARVQIHQQQQQQQQQNNNNLIYRIASRDCFGFHIA